MYILNSMNFRSDVLGLKTCLEMELIKCVHTINTESKGKNCTQAAQADKIVQEFDDVLKGLWCFDGHDHIKIDESVTPFIPPSCKVPFALKDRLRAELERMETTGVITKVTEPTEWVNSIVVTEKKNGKVRVCLDPRDLE